MLPEIGATELLVIAAVALIVVGPKDLPVLMRKLGQFLARMRAMASEFRASFEDMARQSELDELRREVEAMRAARLLDPVAQIGDSGDEVFADIQQGLTAPVIEPEPTPPAPKKPRAPARKKDAKPAPSAPKKPRARKKPETKA